MTSFKLKPKSSFFIFIGLLNASLLVFYLIPILPTALLICLENSFWKISSHNHHDGDFVELFKESFTLYVESGTRMKSEADIDTIWRNQGGSLTINESKLYEIITENYLCKFYCFYLHSTLLTTSLSKYSPPSAWRPNILSLNERMKRLIATKLDAKTHWGDGYDDWNFVKCTYVMDYMALKLQVEVKIGLVWWSNWFEDVCEKVI